MAGGGVIDDVAVWPEVLTDQQIWTFEGRQGPPLPLPVAVLTGVEAGPGPAALAELLAEHLGTGFTVSARLSVQSDAVDGTLLSLIEGEFPEGVAWRLRVEAGHWIVDDRPRQHLGPVATGGQRAVAFVGVADELRRYTDGILRATARREAADWEGAELFVGVGAVPESEFPGEIAELRVYDRALTGEQIEALHGPAVTCPDGCIIDGRCHTEGARSPAPGSCGTCVPDLDPAGWSDTCEVVSADTEFEQFRQGRSTDAGADLLIAANGTVFPYRSLDFDRNDWPDLAFTPAEGGQAKIYLGDEAGYGGEPEIKFDIPPTRRQTAADIDLDGHLDFIVTVAGEDSAPRVYWGGPDGPTGRLFTELGIQHPEGVALGDVDRDGRLDIAVANHPGGVVQIFRGQPGGDGRAVDPAPLGLAASTAWSVALADADRDGSLDLFVASHEESSWAFVTGRGPLQDADPVEWAHTFEDGQIAPIDVNGDGYLDFVGLDQTGLSQWTYQGRQMVRGRGQDLLRAASPLALGDADRDGRLDALARGERSPRPTIHSLRGGAPGFVFLPSGATVLMADLNGDGWPDVVTADADPDAELGGQVVFGTARGFAAGRRIDLDVGGAAQGWERSPGSVFDRRELYFYESRIHESGDAVTGGRIEWDADVTNATAVALQVRGAPTLDGVDDAAWAGPGGATDGWFDAPGRLPAELDGMQFWQYRVRFSRTRPVHGPVLQAVRLSWTMLERRAPCTLGERTTGVRYADRYEQAVRLADGGAATVGVDGDRFDGVVIVSDLHGQERWRAFPGVQGEDRLARLCAHPDGGLLAMGWSGAQGDISVPRYLRYDAQGRLLWSSTTEDGAYRRPAACIWLGDRWGVLDIYAQGDQTLAWSWLDLDDEGNRGVGRRLAGAGRAAVAPEGLRRAAAGELIALLLPMDEGFAITPRYVRFTEDGDVLQDTLIEGVGESTYRAGRTYDRGDLLVIGSDGGLPHAVRIDGAAAVKQAETWDSGELYGAEALGDGALLVGAQESPRVAFHRRLGPWLTDGAESTYPGGTSSRAFAGIPRADSGALVYVLRSHDEEPNPLLSILHTGPDGALSCP